MSEVRKYTVFPGQFIITTAPALISTVLGSCVSVCLWDTVSHMGGMNHYLLPGTLDDDPENSNRGVSATHLLIRSMVNRNSKIKNLEAKIFGGCNSLYRGNDLFRVGERNIQVAMQVLDEYKIKVKAQHTGGFLGRKIVFNTDTGKVRMKLILKSVAKVNEDINKGFSY